MRHAGQENPAEHAERSAVESDSTCCLRVFRMPTKPAATGAGEETPVVPGARRVAKATGSRRHQAITRLSPHSDLHNDYAPPIPPDSARQHQTRHCAGPAIAGPSAASSDESRVHGVQTADLSQDGTDALLLSAQNRIFSVHARSAARAICWPMPQIGGPQRIERQAAGAVTRWHCSLGSCR
jgi:hypothetical protein